MRSPDGHDGPFVNDSRGPGLLRRLFGGGTNDPTAPHAHDAEQSTRTMHRDEPRRDARPRPRPRRRERGTGTSIVLWLLRRMGLRLVLVLVAGIFLLVGSVGDRAREIGDAVDGLQAIQDEFAQTPPTSEPIVPEEFDASQFRATIVSVRDDRVVLEAGATRFDWKVDSPSVYAVLTRNLGEEALVSWELRGSEIHVVGVDGPGGKLAPPD